METRRGTANWLELSALKGHTSCKLEYMGTKCPLGSGVFSSFPPSLLKALGVHGDYFQCSSRPKDAKRPLPQQTPLFEATCSFFPICSVSPEQLFLGLQTPQPDSYAKARGTWRNCSTSNLAKGPFDAQSWLELCILRELNQC